VLALAVYVAGIPALLMWLSRRSDAADLFGSTYTSLRASYRWWLVGSLLWRVAALLVLRLVLDFPTVQVCLFSAIITARIAFVLHWMPYERPTQRRQEAIQSALALLVLVAGVTFYAGGGQLNAATQDFLFMVVVVAVLVHMLNLVYFLRMAWLEHREVECTKRCSLSAAGAAALASDSDAELSSDDAARNIECDMHASADSMRSDAAERSATVGREQSFVVRPISASVLLVPPISQLRTIRSVSMGASSLAQPLLDGADEEELG
jgi:hypothetical protein